MNIFVIEHLLELPGKIIHLHASNVAIVFMKLFSVPAFETHKILVLC